MAVRWATLSIRCSVVSPALRLPLLMHRPAQPVPVKQRSVHDPRRGRQGAQGIGLRVTLALRFDADRRVVASWAATYGGKRRDL